MMMVESDIAKPLHVSLIDSARANYYWQFRSHYTFHLTDETYVNLNGKPITD